jgi:hypothetical protein
VGQGGGAEGGDGECHDGEQLCCEHVVLLFRPACCGGLNVDSTSVVDWWAAGKGRARRSSDGWPRRVRRLPAHRYTEHVTMQVNIPTLRGTGFATFTAANGDTLSANAVGQATPTSVPDQLSIVEVYTITGGTGRFAGATGTFTLESSLNRSTGVSTGAFKGGIDFSMP